MISLLLQTVGWMCGISGRRFRRVFGGLLGRVMMLADRSRLAVTLGNLDSAFPEKSMDWKRRTARAAYRNLGITFAEIAAFPWISDARIRQLVVYDNLDLLTGKYRENRGMMLLSGHFGNWELLAYSAGLFTGIPVAIIVKPQRNRRIDALLNANRTRAGNSVIPFDNAARAIISTLKNGGAVAMLADQAADADRDIFVEFFGRAAATYEAPAALALRLNVPVIIGFAVRQAKGDYRVRLEEIPHDDLTYSPAGVAELTRRHVAALERAVRENPEQWAWQHKRWKYAPKNEPE